MMNNTRYKYPRTPHLPWSPGWTADDVRNISVDAFTGKDIVVTEKMDGENTTLYSDYIHARSIDSRHHPSRDWVKNLHAGIKYQIPDGWRLCGENLYARHSVYYNSLPSYFILFSIWNEKNQCLSWDQTEEWASLFNLTVPAVLYRGPWDRHWFEQCIIDTQQCEGYVVRIADGFHYEQFSQCMAKWVRPSHVQTGTHWMHSEIVPNQLKTVLTDSNTDNEKRGHSDEQTD